jgi:hypothetical protein
MIAIRSAILFMLGAGLVGCAYEGPAAGGASVRALMASQMLPPQPQRETGTEGSAAAAAIANYKQSFVTPVAQSDTPLVGGKK